MLRRPLLLLALALLLPALVAGCGGAADADDDDDGGVASVADGGGDDASAATDEAADADTLANREDAMLALAQCLRENGIDVDDPKPGEGLRLRGPDDAADQEPFEQAQKTCQEKLGDVLPEPSEEDFEAMQASALKFTQCMRENGIDMPDPKFDGGGIRIGAPGSGLDFEDPAFQKAQKACEPILRDARRQVDEDDGEDS